MQALLSCTVNWMSGYMDLKYLMPFLSLSLPILGSSCMTGHTTTMDLALWWVLALLLTQDLPVTKEVLVLLA